MSTPRLVPRPEHVFIGNHTYQVDWITAEEWEAARHPDDASGVTFSSRNLIVVRLMPEARESSYQDVLFHEITHAVWDVTMLTHYHSNVEDGDREEFIIGIQTPGLLFVLQQNPHVVKYLTSDGTVLR